MAATISSAPAAWTTLVTPLAKYEEAFSGYDRLTALPLMPDDLTIVAQPATVSIPTGATGVGVSQGIPVTANFPDEIRQFVTLAQLGFGAQLGTNKRISHWAAAVLLRDMLTSYVNQGCPRTAQKTTGAQAGGLY